MTSRALSLCCSAARCLLAALAARLCKYMRISSSLPSEPLAPSPSWFRVNKQQITSNGHCLMLTITIVIYRKIKTIQEKYQEGYPLACNIAYLLCHLTLSAKHWLSHYIFVCLVDVQCSLNRSPLRTCLRWSAVQNFDIDSEMALYSSFKSHCQNLSFWTVLVFTSLGTTKQCFGVFGL